jgi:hypothetical protein
MSYSCDVSQSGIRNSQDIEEIDSPNRFDVLPDEIVLKIGQYLDQRNSQSLSSVDSRVNQISIPFENALARLGGSKNTITMLQIRNLRELNPKAPTPTHKAWKIDLSRSNVTDDELQFIAKYFPNY